MRDTAFNGNDGAGAMACCKVVSREWAKESARPLYITAKLAALPKPWQR